MTRFEAQDILYAALVAATLIVRAQPHHDDAHAQRQFERIVHGLLSEHLPHGMSVAEIVRRAG